MDKLRPVEAVTSLYEKELELRKAGVGVAFDAARSRSALKDDTDLGRFTSTIGAGSFSGDALAD